MAANIQVKTRARLSTVKITTHECFKDCIKVFSNIEATHRLPSHTTESFSFHANGMLVVKNCSEQAAAVDAEVLSTFDDEPLIIRSNRSSARLWTMNEKKKTVLQGGEALTIRSIHARTPEGTHNV